MAGPVARHMCAPGSRPTVSAEVTHMKTIAGILFLLAAAPGAQLQKIADARWLVGTWKCQDTVGSFQGTYKTTYAAVLGDAWLEQTYDFPARNGRPPQHAECLMSYDPRRQYWVRFFAMSDGMWFAIRMTETGSGWTWKYVSLSKDRKPETPGPDATLTRGSDSEYTIEGPTYEENGVRVTEHHVCRKQ
jgi:hypothetical protein